jgi:pimeloyl-ACP methyl ester carboxylesterase
MTTRRLLVPVSARVAGAAIAAIMMFGACASGNATPTSGGAPALSRTVAAHYANVNGMRMYYEVNGATRGTTRPLVLLHGGGSTIETSFGRVIPALAASRQIIAVELQGHGHTADREVPLSFAQDADDVAALLRVIGVRDVDVLGFSNGANVALELGRRHPDAIRRLVVAAGFVTKDGIPAPVWESFRLPPDTSNMPLVLRDAYRRTAPDPSHLPALVAKLMQRLNGFQDWTDAEIGSVRAPALIMVGDADVITVEHAARMSHLLPHAQLVVFPGATHGAYLGDATAAPCPACVTAAVAFVDRFLADVPGSAAP